MGDFGGAMAVRRGELYEGRYRVVRALGAGGFGETFVAQDEASGEAVVLKTLRLDRAEDWKSVELFEREANMLRNLDHPGIPSYLDWFEVSSDAWCLVQRMAPGQTIAELVTQGWAPTEAEVVDLAHRALEILVYLQDRHPPIIHRDIKPENVLVGESGEVSLVDFGSVKDASKGSKGSTVAGTFGYMAPEQLRGVAHERTDLFGLGSTLLHLMTAQEPEDMPTSRLKIDLSKTIPHASPLLRAWFDRMIDPIDEERFADAAQARSALTQPLPEVKAAPRTPSPVVWEDPETLDPVSATPLPERRGPHEALDALRKGRRGWLLVWFLTLLAGTVSHGLGINSMFSSWIDSGLAALLGGVVMSLGLLGLILSWSRLKRLRTQERVERETRRTLPVSATSQFPMEILDHGDVLKVRRRRGVFRDVLVAGVPSAFAWYSALVAVDYGSRVAIQELFEVLTNPLTFLVGAVFVVVHHLWATRRASLSIDEKGRWHTYEGGVVAREELESWRVVTRDLDDASRVEVSVRVKRRSSDREECVFSVQDASGEAARAQARLLHELIEERLGASQEPERVGSDVVFDLDSVEHEEKQVEQSASSSARK